MTTKQEVAEKLRAAAATITKLNEEKAELLQKVAELEEKIKDRDVASEEGAEPSESALQKEAATTGFTPRGGFGFGSVGEEPHFRGNLTPEERLDLILAGESPSDF